MYIRNKYLLTFNLNEYRNWIRSRKHIDTKETIYTETGKIEVELIKLERTRKTVGKIALAILITLGTAFTFLAFKSVRHLWSGRETKKIALYKNELGLDGTTLKSKIADKDKKINEKEEKINDLQRKLDKEIENQNANRELVEQAAAVLIMKTDGFKKQTEIDKGHEISDGSTFSECHGSPEIRSTAIPFALSVPSALTFRNLRKQKNENLETYYTLLFKRLAHAYSIENKIQFKGSTIHLEGFNETFVVPMNIDTFNQFSKNNSLPVKLIDWMKEIFSNSIWHENVDDSKVNAHFQRIHNPNTSLPALLGSGYDWHSNQVIIYKNLLITCDRGGVSGKEPGIVFYKMNHKKFLTKDYIKKLSNRTTYTKDGSPIVEIQKADPEKLKELGLTKLFKYDKKPQKVGNCTYTSHKLALLALLAIYYLEECKANSEQKESWTMPFSKANKLYKEFNQFDRKNVLEEFLKDIKTEKADIKDPLRQMANLLIAKDKSGNKIAADNVRALKHFVE